MKKELNWEPLIPEFTPDKLARTQNEAHQKAFEILLGARIIESKRQYLAAISSMQGHPIRISEAAEILDCSTQYLRNLNAEGRIKLIVSAPRKFYILPDDISKIALGMV